jgi:tRNA wybutosine-synthesizing protein 3
LSASIDDAQHVLNSALAAGFRESGAVSLGSIKGESNPIVAVRSAGYSFDSIIGYQDENGDNIALVDEKYLRTLVCIANERFSINFDRITRFRNALLETQKHGTSYPPDWEDADARKQRKREEGLARQQTLRNKEPQHTQDESMQKDLDDIGGMFS